MPEIKFKHIVSFSSEDKNFPAENLLKSDGFKKWKSGTAGEKQVSAVIQLEKAVKINSIDIGNEGSAFVEVLVGRSSDLQDKNYQVLLVASSFMTPGDSRNGTNGSRVRMFGPDALSKTVAQEKWDVVKVVCTQPFNRSSQYGLGFIKLHAPPQPGEASSPAASAESTEVKKFGLFKMKTDDSSKNDPIPIGGLFAQRNKPDPAPLTGAAAMRAASKLAEESMMTTPAKTPAPKPERTPSQHNSDKMAAKTTPAPKRKHEEEDEKPAMRRQATSEKKSKDTSAASSSSSHQDGPPPTKKAKAAPSKPLKPFNKLMENVTFVLSGFQNPYRGELRDFAMEMGAKYKGDWGRGCTHLICAFANTPKFNSVKGKGKIVSRHWITDSHEKKKLMPWRKYKIGDYDSPSSSSTEDDEADEDMDWATAGKAVTNKKPEQKASPSQNKLKPTAKSKIKYQDSSTDMDSDADTDDEIQRHLAADKAKKQQKKSPAKPAARADDDNIYGASTDEDEAPAVKAKSPAMASPSKSQDLPDLPNFFTKKNFMLYGDFSNSERKALSRFIVAYDGDIEQYMTEKVNYVITKSSWDDEFDKALSDQPSLQFVKPQWVFDCDEKQKLMPHQKYLVVPS
ncbi:DNA repair protein XRCC1-like [Lineus longissimus]|uniref:DNA repair protein XRCC1-like n=1 Tax=Lineus longissimus TaxID=88925 RepID=UPI002B4F394F